MRRIQLIALIVTMFALLAAAGPTLAGKGTDYGDGLTGKKTIKISKLLANPAPFVGEIVRVRGVVTGVCEKAGCWMTLAAEPGSEELRVKVDDGVIVFPVSARGKRAIAEGRFDEIAMSHEQTVAHQRHLAEERGDSFDPGSVTEPMVYYRIKATGARVF